MYDEAVSYDPEINSLRNRVLFTCGIPGFVYNTYFMYCLPPGVPFEGIAYAFTNSWMTVYSDGWCGYVSGQLHELGHNFNLDHAADGALEYDDQTGVMGYSYNVDDQRMCYNAANMYQLGWLRQVQQFSSQPSGTINLVGHTNYGGGIQAIRLKRIPASQDTYIWFNHASGINVDTLEGRDQVIVTTRPAGTGCALISMVAKLSVGGQYAPVDAYCSLQVMDISNGMAVVSFDGGSSIIGISSVPPINVVPVPQETPAPVPVPVPAPPSCPRVFRRRKCPRPRCVFINGRCQSRAGAASKVQTRKHKQKHRLLRDKQEPTEY